MQKLISTSMTIYRDQFQEVNIDGYVVYSEDNEYGADADGNRATKRITVEEVKDIFAYEVDGDTISLSQEEKEQAEDLLTTKFMEG